MDEWWTYQLSDLILFSSHTYYRLIELYNTAIWPLQIIAIIIGCTVLVLVWRRPHWHGKAITIILALSWLWIAWSFHWQRFANIHWVASYFALGFIIQALLLIWVGVIKNHMTINLDNIASQFTGLGILGFAIAIQPFIMMLTGNIWKQVELFALTPDPTVTASIGVLLLTDIRKHWWLTIIPLVWCVISAATLWALDSANAFVMIAIGLMAIFAWSWKVFMNSK